MLTFQDIFFALVQGGLLILGGRFIHQKSVWLQRLFVPEAVIAGTVALLLGPEVLGKATAYFTTSESPFVAGLFSAESRAAWSQAPPVLINIVFASLFLGEEVPNPRQIWQRAAPQIVFGQVLAWGQYVVGLGVTLLVLVPFFEANPMAGILIEMSFEGGHAASGAMAQTLIDLGFEEGVDLALGMSTVGIVSGIVIGMALANWAQQQGLVSDLNAEPSILSVADLSVADKEILSQKAAVSVSAVSDGENTRRAELMQNLQLDPLSLNFGFVAIAVAIGWLILTALRYIEAITWGRSGFECIAYVPLFPMTLIGSLLLQIILKRLNLDALVIKPLVEHISGFALDLIIVTAIASISLTGLSQNFATFAILSLSGIVWNVSVLFILAPRLFSSYWFERSLGDFGQSMGVTATGLLLLRLVDPKNRSGAIEAFAYKQLLFTPIVGGGIFSAAAPALIFQIGAEATWGVTTVLLFFWLAVGFILSHTESAAENKQKA